MQIDEAHSNEQCEAALDSLWSLQYMTGPGILCAFAGQSYSLQAKPAIIEGQTPTASHAAYFRFTSSVVSAWAYWEENCGKL